MRTLGIDLASMPKDTAACLVRWERGHAVAEAPRLGCTDADLDESIRAANVIGIDAPFGWPDAFRAAVADWTATAWTADAELRTRLRLRLTDRRVQSQLGLIPLSVSTDRIALPAMRAMALLRRHGVSDRAGDGRFFEVYPAGSLKVWVLPHRSYKGLLPAVCAGRATTLQQLRSALPWLEVPAVRAATDHGLDALIAALTARCCATDRAQPPAKAGFTCRSPGRSRRRRPARREPFFLIS
jgi:predicted nuclease with RNAse H fold